MLIIRTTEAVRDKDCDVQVYHTNYPEIKIILYSETPNLATVKTPGSGAKDEWRQFDVQDRAVIDDPDNTDGAAPVHSRHEQHSPHGEIPDNSAPRCADQSSGSYYTGTRVSICASICHTGIPARRPMPFRLSTCIPWKGSSLPGCNGNDCYCTPATLQQETLT